MVFKARVEAKETNGQCLVILKESFHPSWKATIDGTPVKPFAVFPFFIAIGLPESGTHEVVFSYQPSKMKVFLLVLSLIGLGGLLLSRFVPVKNWVLDK